MQSLMFVSSIRCYGRSTTLAKYDIGRYDPRIKYEFGRYEFGKYEFGKYDFGKKYEFGRYDPGKYEFDIY